MDNRDPKVRAYEIVAGMIAAKVHDWHAVSSFAHPNDLEVMRELERIAGDFKGAAESRASSLAALAGTP